jgi:hypothetical protein
MHLPIVPTTGKTGSTGCTHLVPTRTYALQRHRVADHHSSLYVYGIPFDTLLLPDWLDWSSLCLHYIATKVCTKDYTLVATLVLHICVV